MYADVTNILTYRNGGSPNGVVRPSSLSEAPKRRFWESLDVGRKIRNFARGQTCTLRLRGCNGNPETVVFAHAPSIDNGMGLKQAKDFWGAFACSNCHDMVDGRVSTKDDRITILERWLAGIYETQKRLIEAGLMTFDDR
jgi:hypothetical protein